MEEVLRVNHLTVNYHTGRGSVRAVDDMSFSLKRGEILGIVGESGCGKSTVAKTVMGLLNSKRGTIENGEILFEGIDLRKIEKARMNDIRGKQISMIFQNPSASLNPVFRIGSQIEEVLKLHGNSMSKEKRRERALELLKLTGIPSPEERLMAYPHQLSGGMQQRIMIAMALAYNPSILIADEPTTALDVTIQAQILALLDRIRKDYQMSILLITHNMGVVAQMCDRVMVMYGGAVVESGTAEDIFFRSSHPYTKGLLASAPSLIVRKKMLDSIPGQVPKWEKEAGQCRFLDRCQDMKQKRICVCCKRKEPELFQIGEQHYVRCYQFQNREQGENYV